MENSKKTILIDLDGVLNSYKAGEFDEEHIPEIHPEAEYFLRAVVHMGYAIKLFTTRNKILAAKWLIRYDLDKYVDDITNTKELCWLYIDDRCLQFDGNFPALCLAIKNFKPWYK